MNKKTICFVGWRRIFVWKEFYNLLLLHRWWWWVLLIDIWCHPSAWLSMWTTTSGSRLRIPTTKNLIHFPLRLSVDCGGGGGGDVELSRWVRVAYGCRPRRRAIVQMRNQPKWVPRSTTDFCPSSSDDDGPWRCCCWTIGSEWRCCWLLIHAYSRHRCRYCNCRCCNQCSIDVHFPVDTVALRAASVCVSPPSNRIASHEIVLPLRLNRSLGGTQLPILPLSSSVHSFCCTQTRSSSS